MSDDPVNHPRHYTDHPRHYGVDELRLNEAKNAEREEVLAYYAGVFGWCLLDEVRRMGVIEEVA